jgi:hypothetical protein
VENTLHNVFVNDINVPNLNKITIGPEHPTRMESITPQDRRDIGRDLAFLGGNGSAAAVPEPDADSGLTVANTLSAGTHP